MDSAPDLLFGRLAVMNGFLTQEKLQFILRKQEEDVQTGDPSKNLGELCQMYRLMTPQQVQKTLLAQEFLGLRREDRKIGSLAVKNGFVSEEDVKFALDAQKKSFQEDLKTPKPLGEILVEAELLTRQQLNALLKMQARLQPEPAAAPAVPPPPPAAGPGEITGRLIQILGEGKGQTFPIQGKVVLGRHPANEVPIPDRGSSRQHAMIEFRPAAKQHLLIDLNSQNGTFLHNQRVTDPTPLKSGDVIRIGETAFQYEPGNKVQPDFIPPGDTIMISASRMEALRTEMTSTRLPGNPGPKAILQLAEWQAPGAPPEEGPQKLKDPPSSR